jgi:hypothetical protein
VSADLPDRDGGPRESGVRALGDSDPLVRALARYVEALHRRYPGGPDELRREGLDARAKVSEMARIQKDPAA